MMAKTEIIGAGVEIVKISANPDYLITKISLQSTSGTNFVFLSTNKKVRGIGNSEVGSRKSMEKSENIMHTTYIFGDTDLNKSHLYSGCIVIVFCFALYTCHILYK